ncbi:MAG: nuclear transport factor 2 family protein [Methanomassiliicoccales archaeon]|nr:MAG: nuclear transport factor 2 family protein [Methanomassiliicoccales archaeon]
MEIKNEQDFREWKATTEASREVVQRAIDALNRGDSEGFINAFSEDFDFRMPGSTPVSGRTKGIQEFAALVGKVAGYLDVLITIKVTNFISCGEWVVTEAVGHGVTKKFEDYNNTYCHLWQVQNGKIVKFVEYNDTDLIMRVLCAE